MLYRFSFPGFSYNSILGKFMVFVTDVDVARSVFSYNDPTSLLMAVHPSAKNILGPKNLAFMHGPPHKAIRKSFLSLFTRKALGTYMHLQDGVIRKHLADWLKEFAGQERDIRPFIRHALAGAHEIGRDAVIGVWHLCQAAMKCVTHWGGCMRL